MNISLWLRRRKSCVTIKLWNTQHAYIQVSMITNMYSMIGSYNYALALYD